jgi:hypothetical protein
MKKTALMFICFALFCSGALAFEKTITNPTSDKPAIYGVHATGDGGSIIVGSYEKDPVGGEGFLILTDASGNTVFHKVDNSYLYRDAAKLGGGFIIAAALTFTVTTQWDNTYQLVVITANAAGANTGERISGDAGTTPVSMAKSPDGSGFVIAADHYNYNAAGYTSPYFEKVDNSGAKVWSNHFDFGQDIYFYGITALSDGGYLAEGYTDFEGFLLKVDADGNSVWSKSSNSCTSYDGATIRPDGNIIAVGYAYDGTNYYFITQCMDNGGNIIWSGSYDPGYDFNDYSIFYSGSSDYGYIISGSTDSVSQYSYINYNFAMTIDAAGNTKNISVFGNGADNVQYGLGAAIGNQQADIVGTINDTDIYWSRYTMPSIAVAPPPGGSSAHKTYAYPQPASDSINIVYSLSAQSNVTIYIYNFANNLVGKSQTLESPDNSVVTNINVSRLKPGVYFYQVVAKAVNGSETRYTPEKFMVKR